MADMTRNEFWDLLDYVEGPIIKTRRQGVYDGGDKQSVVLEFSNIHTLGRQNDQPIIYKLFLDPPSIRLATIQYYERKDCSWRTRLNKKKTQYVRWLEEYNE